jgi:hypothetical protein
MFLFSELPLSGFLFSESFFVNFFLAKFIFSDCDELCLRVREHVTIRNIPRLFAAIVNDVLVESMIVCC